MSNSEKRVLVLDNGLAGVSKICEAALAADQDTQFERASELHIALQKLKVFRPQVLLLDLRLTGTEIAATVRQLRNAWPQISIIGMASEPQQVAQGRQIAGIDECLLANNTHAPMLAIIMRHAFLRGRQNENIIRLRRELHSAKLHSDRLPHDNGANQNINSTVSGDERYEFDARLAQAQKMEALGQLTGGLAHDFNNLLAVIIGNLQLIQRSLANDERLAKQANAALDAATRGAKLTRQMLTFARRQPLDPQAIAMPELLGDFAEILDRTLGGAIKVQVQVAPDVWAVMADPSLLESAILNLAINARDAMPNGGNLRIEVCNLTIGDEKRPYYPELKPGDYVVLSVSDQGVGISPAVLARVTEPFFTTKAPGSGTGLGLSMVHGFASQSGGHFELQSQLGKGTTASIFMPKATATDVEQTAATQTSLRAIPNGSERILLVEDDSNVREVARSMLATLGYTVFEVSDADEALANLRQRTDIDLVFTDIVMPGRINGADLGRQLRNLYPALKILYTSGYTGSNEGNEIETSLQPFLSKPYRLDTLAVKVREVLDDVALPGRLKTASSTAN